MKKMQGFTLIELMIVIALIGILATIAVPAYQHHVVRARVTEGLELASSAKLAVSESVVSNNGLPEGNIALGFTSPTATENVASIQINHQSGDITITYTAKAGNGTIVLNPIVQPTGEIVWRCKEGTLSAKYRPSICR